MKTEALIYEFDRKVNRFHTNSEKYDGASKFAPNAPKDKIPLWIADMDFQTAPEIIEAMQKRVEEGIFGYTNIYDSSYYEAVGGWMEKRHGWKVKQEEIVLDSGVVPAVLHALSLMAQPGDGVILHTPSYTPFYNSIRTQGMRTVFSPLLLKNGRYEIDLEDLEKKASDPENKVLIFCSPHNPSGRVWTREELTAVMEICRKHHVSVISDEIHGDLLRAGRTHLSLAGLFPEEKRLIVCTSPSKTFNLAGNHLANIIIPDREIREEWEKRYHYMPNPTSVAATVAAYTRAEGWADALNQYLDGTFQMMEQYIKSHMTGVSFTVPEGTYLAWIDMRNCGLAHKEMVNRFLKNGLLIEGGEQFVADGEGFVRMNIAAPRCVIQEALERMSTLF